MTYIHGKAHLLPTVVGLAMAAIAGIHTAGSAFVVAVACGLAVGVAIRVRHAATTAVLLAAVAVMLSNAPPPQAGLVGLCGAYYLLLRHTERGQVGRSPIAAAVCFTVVAVLIASVPLDLPWLTILAGPTMFVAYMVALRPFFPSAASSRRASSDRT
ncbi:hypothetical protein [Mycolicibacterium vinylchloridicum]|uniref:hypothetical protein n=1 Tax=Mycolicibacterium vinylchloridicum TaxID=2736928 RepID=UPI0015CBB621|nr:hypothetical protein [Mycolicibacterium vinylchloridicum]